MTVDLARVAPLAHRVRDLERMARTRPGLTAREVAFEAHVDLRVDPTNAGRVPFELPAEPNTVAASQRAVVLWLGPDEWLVVGAPATAERLVDELGAALGDTHHSVVDVSANRAVIELGGAARRDVLSMGCSLDLEAWRPGVCAQTLLARLPVILEERDGTTRIYVRPSFGDYIVDWLLDAASAEPVAARS